MGTHEAYLQRALSTYRHPDQTKREVLGIFQIFTDLRPTVMNYVFTDGQKKELLCLEGTIPVTYKDKTYNIPICIYLMDTHPYNPPIVYVKPTPTMQIKQGRHVDATGRVYLPYLHEWKQPSSDLLGLIQILAIVFGEDPPVFSKQQNAPAATSSQPLTQQTPGSVAPSFTSATQSAITSASNASALSVELSLLSAIEERMKIKLRETLAQAQAEEDVLKKTQEDLQRGRERLDMLQKLEREQQ